MEPKPTNLEPRHWTLLTHRLARGNPYCLSWITYQPDFRLKNSYIVVITEKGTAPLESQGRKLHFPSRRRHLCSRRVHQFTKSVLVSPTSFWSSFPVFCAPLIVPPCSTHHLETPTIKPHWTNLVFLRAFTFCCATSRRIYWSPLSAQSLLFAHSLIISIVGRISENRCDWQKNTVSFCGITKNNKALQPTTGH